MSTPNEALRVVTPEPEDRPPSCVPSVHATVQELEWFGQDFAAYQALGGLPGVARVRDHHFAMYQDLLKAKAALAEVEARLREFTLTELRGALFFEARKYHFSGPPPDGRSAAEVEYMRLLVRQIRAKVAHEECG